MTTIINIADAVASELNATEFSQSFEAVRAYRPVYDLAEMSDLHVTVVPKATSKAVASRSSLQVEHQVDVAVQQKPADLENATLDALMALVDEIGRHLERRTRLTALPVVWVASENAPIYSPEHLEKFRQFTSVLTLTYRVIE